MTAEEIAAAFNSFNDRRSWSARSMRRDGTEFVYFHGSAGMIVLELDVQANEFHLRFHKLTAAWGDYIVAIGRSLFSVLTTLKAAGLPFEAPESPEHLEVWAGAAVGSTDVKLTWRDVDRPTLPGNMLSGADLSDEFASDGPLGGRDFITSIDAAITEAAIKLVNETDPETLDQNQGYYDALADLDPPVSLITVDPFHTRLNGLAENYGNTPLV